jgi:sigma-B regulation protein RsbU (phosphoserine phosphatase)
MLTQATGVDSRVMEPVFLIVALIVFQPAISQLEELLDRLLLRDPGDYRNVLRNLGRELQTTIDLEALLQRAVTTVAEALLARRALVLATARDGVILSVGAGVAPAPEDEAHLAALLARLPARDGTVRVDAWSALEPDDHALLEQRLGASLILPLRSRGEIVGAMLLGDKVTGTDYTSEDVQLLDALASQLGVLVQNALLVRERVGIERLEEELRLARQIQRSLLASRFPPMPRFDVHALNIPSKEVGGDLRLGARERDIFLLAIAVAGHGGPPRCLVDAAGGARAEAANNASGGAILANSNSPLFRATAENQFATFFLARVNNTSLEMTFSNAGHNYPMIVRRNGEPMFLDRGGTVLGIREGTRYEEGRVRLEAGDVMMLYTDGISEATDCDNEQFGDGRLCDLVRSLPRGLSAREVADQVRIAAGIPRRGGAAATT